MKAAILQCDQVLEKLQPQFGHYPDMIENMFHAVEDSITFDTFDCQQGDFPSPHQHYDFYITTGSKAAAYDDQPWIKQLIQYIKNCYRLNKKLIGICFGHQLIALALGGQVENSSKGWGVGLSNNHIVKHPLWMGKNTQEIKIIVSHQDQVSRLPDQAMIIAQSEFCPYFIVQWGQCFLSIQGHPEWTEDYSEALMNERTHIIPAPVIETGKASLINQPDNILFTQWILNFIHYKP